MNEEAAIEDDLAMQTEQRLSSDAESSSETSVKEDEGIKLESGPSSEAEKDDEHAHQIKMNTLIRSKRR